MRFDSIPNIKGCVIVIGVISFDIFKSFDVYIEQLSYRHSYHRL